MLLYKYFTPSRLSFFRSFELRFTQPIAFNDPFEAEPYVDSLGDEAEIRRIVKADFLTRLPEIWNDLPAESKAQVPFEKYLEHYKTDPDPMVEQLVRSAATLIPELRLRMSALINSTIGILSLTEDSQNLLMWSHYADGHQGFVVGFDSEHSFFKQLANDDGEANYFLGLHPVTYSEERPRVAWLQLSAAEAFLTKSTMWKHEKEWRGVTYLKNASRRDDAFKPPAFLFVVPATCLRRVILGCKIDARTRNEILAIIRSSPALGHVTVSQAQMDDNSFAVRVESMTV